MTEQGSFGIRIRAVRGALSQIRFAELLNVSLKTVQRYERGESRVDAAFLQVICEKFSGISAEWLLTGGGPMHSGQRNLHWQMGGVIDESLMILIGEKIAEIYCQKKSQLDPAAAVRLATRVYGDLMAAYESHDECLVGLKGMLESLKRELDG